MRVFAQVSIGILLAVPAGASDIQVAFSPNGGATDLVVCTIESAHHTIRMAAYTFTSRPIALALLDARQRGVDVQMVGLIAGRTTGATHAHYVAANGIPVRGDAVCVIMHNKFIVVDNKTVEEGSFHYTAAAERKNAENVVVLHDREVAKEFTTEWVRLWNESAPI
jgi:phosphatidylserine/phosphatidylglycerophosphate/cardiolipin synthase-like enzyme